MNTTDPQQTFDGTIEGAVGLITQPAEEEPVEETESPEASDEPEVNEADLEDDTEEVASASDEEDGEEQDESDDTEDEAGQSAPELFSVKVDGEEVQVSLEDLKRGYSGQQYVQKGMQEAAAKRKEAEEVYSALLAERQQLANLYQQIQGGQIAQAPTPPSKDLFDRDPIGYMEEKMKYDEAKAKHDQQQAQFAQLSKQQTEAQQRARQAYLQQEMEQLKTVIPELGDPEKANQVKEKLITGGREIYGYTPEEIGQIVDHRAIRVLKDALAYREIMSGKQKAEQKVKPAKPMLKAGSKKQPDSKLRQQQQRKAQLKKSGRIEDALSLILQNT